MGSSKNIRICLLGASFSTKNLGVGALAAGSIECLRDIFPKGDIYLMDYSKSSSSVAVKTSKGVIHCSLVNIRFSKRVFLRNNVAFLIFLAIFARLLYINSLKRFIYERNDLLKMLNNTDLFASIAGGDSFSDIYGLTRLIYVTLPQFLVILMGKKLVHLPQTIGPFRSTLSRSIGRYILKKSCLVFSRNGTGNDQSLSALSSTDIKKKTRFCHDLGFYISPIRPTDNELVDIPSKLSNPLLIGLNISGLLYIGGYNRDNMFNLKIHYPDYIQELIRLLIDKTGAHILLVPHVLGSSDNPESDVACCKKVYGELDQIYRDHLTPISGQFDQNEIKFIIGLCDFFIGSRMHACIAALSQCVPTVAISYSDKFSGVFKSIGLSNSIADPRAMLSQDISLTILDNLHHKDSIRKYLNKTIPKTKDSILRNLSELRDI